MTWPWVSCNFWKANWFLAGSSVAPTVREPGHQQIEPEPTCWEANGQRCALKSLKMKTPVPCFWSNRKLWEGCQCKNMSPVQVVPPPPWRAVEGLQTVTRDLQRQNKWMFWLSLMACFGVIGCVLSRKHDTEKDSAWYVRSDGEIWFYYPGAYVACVRLTLITVTYYRHNAKHRWPTKHKYNQSLCNQVC